MAKIKIYKRSTGSYDTGNPVKDYSYYNTLGDKTISINGGVGGGDNNLQLDEKSIGMLLQLFGQGASSLIAPDNRIAANAMNNITSFAGLGTQIAPGVGTIVGAGAGILKSVFEGKKMAAEDRRLNKQFTMNQQAENTLYNRDIGLNPFMAAFGMNIPYQGNVPIQAEKYQGQPEYIESNDNLYKTNASTSHENMDPNQATDMVNGGDFVFSARNKLSKKQWEAVATVLNNQGKNVNPQVIDYLTKNSKSKSISPAAMAEKVNSLYSIPSSNSIFNDSAKKLNDRNKEYLLEQIKVLNQAINPDKQDQANALPSAMEQGTRQAPWGGFFPNGNPVQPNNTSPATPKTDCGSQISIGLENGHYKIKQFCNSGCVPDSKLLPPNNAVKDKVYTTPCVPSGGGNTPPKKDDSTDCASCIHELIIQGIPPKDAETMCGCSKEGPPSSDSQCNQCVENLRRIYEQTGQQRTTEQLLKECACFKDLNPNNNLVSSDCDTCVKEYLAANATKLGASSSEDMSKIAKSKDSNAIGKFVQAANSFGVDDLDYITEQARKYCNCPEATSGDKGPEDGGTGLGGDSGKVLGLKMFADAALAGAKMRQKMYDLSQFNMTPTLNMVDQLDPTGTVNKIERTGRNTINSLSGQLPFGMLAANALGVQSQVGNQVGDFMSKLVEMNANLKNNKQAAMQQQLDKNREYVQGWLIDKTKRDNMAILAPAEAMQSSTKAILEWYKDAQTRQGQEQALKSLMETLGITQ